MEIVDDEVHFRVNHDKFNVHIRNKIIVNAARERFNDGAALVVQAALKATEDKSKTVKDPRSGLPRLFSYVCIISLAL